MSRTEFYLQASTPLTQVKSDIYFLALRIQPLPVIYGSDSYVCRMIRKIPVLNDNVFLAGTYISRPSESSLKCQRGSGVVNLRLFSCLPADCRYILCRHIQRILPGSVISRCAHRESRGQFRIIPIQCKSESIPLPVFLLLQRYFLSRGSRYLFFQTAVFVKKVGEHIRFLLTEIYLYLFVF